MTRVLHHCFGFVVNSDVGGRAYDTVYSLFNFAYICAKCVVTYPDIGVFILLAFTKSTP